MPPKADALFRKSLRFMEDPRSPHSIPVARQMQRTTLSGSAIQVEGGWTLRSDNLIAGPTRKHGGKNILIFGTGRDG